GDHNPRCAALSRKKLAHETFGRLGIAAFLDQNLQHEAILINRSPKNVMLTFDRNNNLIQMPLVTKAWCPATDITGIGPSEFLGPFIHCLICDEYPAISQHIFDHAKAQWKAKIQ